LYVPPGFCQYLKKEEANKEKKRIKARKGLEKIASMTGTTPLLQRHP
jgi:hypothetical protein